MAASRMHTCTKLLRHGPAGKTNPNSARVRFVRRVVVVGVVGWRWCNDASLGRRTTHPRTPAFIHTPPAATLKFMSRAKLATMAFSSVSEKKMGWADAAAAARLSRAKMLATRSSEIVGLGARWYDDDDDDDDDDDGDDDVDAGASIKSGGSIPAAAAAPVAVAGWPREYGTTQESLDQLADAAASHSTNWRSPPSEGALPAQLSDPLLPMLQS